MAGLALQFSVACTESEQAPARRGSIRIGSKARVSPGFESPVGIDGHGFPFTIVVAGLTGGHVEPALAGCITYCSQSTMAGLAFHEVLACCIHRISHGATQALGFRAGVTIVACAAVFDGI